MLLSPSETLGHVEAVLLDEEGQPASTALDSLSDLRRSGALRPYRQTQRPWRSSLLGDRMLGDRTALRRSLPAVAEFPGADSRPRQIRRHTLRPDDLARPEVRAGGDPFRQIRGSISQLLGGSDASQIERPG